MNVFIMREILHKVIDVMLKYTPSVDRVREEIATKIGEALVDIVSNNVDDASIILSGIDKKITGEISNERIQDIVEKIAPEDTDESLEFVVEDSDDLKRRRGVLYQMVKDGHVDGTSFDDVEEA